MITDSEWVYKAITQWEQVWARNHWKSTSGEVHHGDLCEQLVALTSGRPQPVTYQHIPSHIGVPGNEGADRLAEEGRMQHPYVLATPARGPSVHLHQATQQQVQGGDAQGEVEMVGHPNDGPQQPVALGLDLEAEADIGGRDVEVEVVGAAQGVAWAGEEVEGEGFGSGESDLGSSEYSVHTLVGSRESEAASSDRSACPMDEESDSSSASGLKCQSARSEADTVGMGSSEELGPEPLAQVTQARGMCEECDTGCSNSDSDHRADSGIASRARTLPHLTSWRPRVTTKNT